MSTATLGFGKEAELIERTMLRNRQDLRQSNALGIQPALKELYEVASECQTPDWDGYGASPVTQESFDAALRLLDSLPYGFPIPSVSADPDGQLTFEWYRCPTRNLSISIDPDGLLHFAGLFGENRHHGIETFFDRIPEPILRLAGEVF